MRWKRVTCFFLGHKWEYLSKPQWIGRARGCSRCDKREVQVKTSCFPNGWAHVDWSWDWFKKFESRWDKRKETKEALFQ